MSDEGDKGCSCGCGCALWVPAFITFIVFLVLKLTDTISWDWVWICSPLWIAAALSAIGFVLMLILGFGVVGVVIGTILAAIGFAGLADRFGGRR